MLIVMAGLPGAGKSSVAETLGRRLAAPVVSVDPIEAAIWRAGVARDQPTGLAAYVVAEAVAGGVLALGQTVIADAVNAVEAAREQWRSLARRHGVPVAFIEVVCSDPVVHCQRWKAAPAGSMASWNRGGRRWKGCGRSSPRGPITAWCWRL
ncbi:ATP-binding protein [Streptomyces sp. NPDC051662]|uniref:AAA family ATPase n=1 Tax=Streptomyces sp. NPDC051662 TaxID=3154750 RepID=UPI0034195407